MDDLRCRGARSIDVSHTERINGLNPRIPGRIGTQDMDVRERRCGLCGQLNPPASEFCADCGVLLASVATTRSHENSTNTIRAAGLSPRRSGARPRGTPPTHGDRVRRRSGAGLDRRHRGVACALVRRSVRNRRSRLHSWITWLSSSGFLAAQTRRPQYGPRRHGNGHRIVGRSRRGAGANARPYAGRRSLTPAAIVAIPTPTPDPAEVSVAAGETGAVMPMFRGNAARTGENPGPAPLERPVVKWKTFVGGESYASPVVGHGDRLCRHQGRESRRPAARRTGASGGGSMSGTTSPAPRRRSLRSTLFVAAGYALLAIDAETGQERWSVPLRFAGSCSPVVDGDLVYVATQEGHVSAFATETGEEVWHYRNDNLLFGSPAVADGVVVIADEAGVVTAIDASHGREMWQRTAGGEVFATPAIARGVAFVATNEPSLTAFDLQIGDRALATRDRWRVVAGRGRRRRLSRRRRSVGPRHRCRNRRDALEQPARICHPVVGTFADDGVYIGSGPTVTAIDRRRWRARSGPMSPAATSRPTLRSSPKGSSPAAMMGTSTHSGRPSAARAKPTEVSIRDRGVLLAAGR